MTKKKSAYAQVGNDIAAAPKTRVDRPPDLRAVPAPRRPCRSRRDGLCRGRSLGGCAHAPLLAWASARIVVRIWSAGV